MDSSLDRKKIKITYTVSLESDDTQIVNESLDNSEDAEFDQRSRLVQKILSWSDQGQNLRNIDLSNNKPNRINLSGADMSGADLSDADVSCADLSYADLSGTDLSGTDLSGTTVKNARFETNAGLTEDMKIDLVRRGAIFDQKEKVTSF
jgi:uncharacterized protein YjbI with pentapeptide repeats